MRKGALIALLFSGIAISSRAQGDLMSMLDSNSTATKAECVIATFKATRIINSSSVENLAHGALDLRISHRFGRLDQGTSNFFGFDNATTRIGLDYGITNWLMVGLGHSTLLKENDGFLKARILRQQKSGMPITLSYVATASAETLPAPALAAGQEWYYTNRLAYAHQILIARKFSDHLSLQLMPTLVHYNLIDSSKNSNNTIAIGIGGRYKVSRSIAITAEYFYRVTNDDMLYNGVPTHNSFSIGADIETGGHVFQLMFTNSAGITERTYIGQTTEDWSKSGIHFGFNISRVFTVVRPKEFVNAAPDKKW
jgi:opacity protein-like surface antigen